MKKLFLFFFMILGQTFNLLSAEETLTPNVPNEQIFKDIKEKMLKGIDARITTLNNAKACISEATNRETLRSCREKMREAHKELKKEAQKNRHDKRNKK